MNKSNLFKKNYNNLSIVAQSVDSIYLSGTIDRSHHVSCAIDQLDFA